MTAIHITFDRDAAPSREDFEAWARGNGLRFPASEHSGVYRKGPAIDVDYSRTRVVFTTFYMAPEMPELILMALSFWQRFRGRMEAPPEVIVAIRQAFLAMHPVPEAAKS